MPAPEFESRRILQEVLQGRDLKDVAARLEPRMPERVPLPPRIPDAADWSKEAHERRIATLRSQGIRLKYLTGEEADLDPAALQGNIENYVGMAQVPVAVIGPLRINGANALGDFYVPMATTEGALIASHQRGAYVIGRSGGVRALCLTQQMGRAPGFVFRSMGEAGAFLAWGVEQFEALQRIAQSTTRHGRLQDILWTLAGNQVFALFEYSTGDAAGQNMVTIATDAVCRHIVARAPVKPRYWFVESNLSGDKKATALSFLFTRGKKVTAEVVVPRQVVQRFLRTTPETILEYCKVSAFGAIQSGAMGIQGHYANALAAMFIACGQDVACVAEAAIGMTRMDRTDDGDLYVSVTLPNLAVGTVGGGTGLPTQRECLEMLGCTGDGTAPKFAEICAATALAGEISITGALAAGHFAEAHEKFGRKVKSHP